MIAVFKRNIRAFFIALFVLSLTLLGGCADAPDKDEAYDGLSTLSNVSVEPISDASLSNAEDLAALQANASLQKTLRVQFIDVGQGDCALLTCGDQSLLIDGGPREAAQKTYAILKDQGITHLDHVIATHPDEDHCGGMAGALHYATCGAFYCSVDHHDTETFNDVLASLQGAPVIVPSVGDEFMLDAAKVRFVGPAERTQDSNNGSLVCRVDFGETSFLFTGDAEAESEAQMMASGENLDVDVLKVGHHGSGSSSSSAFLERVTPKFAVVSVGANGYGHPDGNALARLVDSGAQVTRTDENGTVTFESDGTDITMSLTRGKVVDAASIESAAAAEAAAASPSPAPAPPASVQSTESQEITVYVAASGNGKRYHTNPTCSRMKGAVSLSISEAEAQGYTPCKKCC